MLRARFPHSALIISALLAAAVTMTTLTAGCATATHVPGGGPRRAVFVEHDASNGKTVRIGVGDQITLILASSYWKIRGSSAPGVLRQRGPVKLLAPSPSSCPPGFGCRPVRVYFSALAPGTAVITAHRTTCGEALACTGSRGRFRLTVIVSKSG
jgi:hypothetical protein